MNVEKARVHYLSMNDNPIVRNKPVLCFDYKGYNLYILEEEKNESTYLLYKDEYGEYWNFYNYSITYDRFDQVINNKLDKYNPDFDSCKREKTPHPLFYKGLESFNLLKKMRNVTLYFECSKIFLKSL